MVDLFRAKEPAPEPPAEDYQQDLADARLMEEQRARIEDLVAFNADIIRPTRLEGSKYHALVTKDFKVSNFRNIGRQTMLSDEEMVGKAVSIIDHALYMGFESFAVILHCELIASLAAKGSVEGFEREALISQISRMTKQIGKPEEKKGFKL